MPPRPPYSLQEVSVKIIKSEICNQQYQFLLLKGQKKFIGKDMLCASLEWGVDSCQVRSGWPRAGRGLLGAMPSFNMALGDFTQVSLPRASASQSVKASDSTLLLSTRMVVIAVPLRSFALV